ncbi:hypothetical protein ACU8V3_15795 [Cobetia marina]
MKSMIFQSGMWLRNGIAAVGMTLMLASPAYAIELPSEQGDDTPSAGMMVADALVGRPLLLATTVVGAALFVVSAPFAAMGRISMKLLVCWWLHRRRQPSRAALAARRRVLTGTDSRWGAT